MTLGHRIFRIPASSIALAIALALAACGDKAPADKAAKAVPPVPAVPEKKVEPAQEPPAAKAAEAPKVNPDLELAAKVKSALGADPALGKLTVDVASKDGAVTLFGTADTKANREKATQVARAVPGVKSVENKMVLVAGS